MELGCVFITTRALDEAQTEEAGIKIDICLNLPRDQGDVVDAACHEYLLGPSIFDCYGVESRDATLEGVSPKNNTHRGRSGGCYF
jgi:hypothetical protein